MIRFNMDVEYYLTSYNGSKGMNMQSFIRGVSLSIIITLILTSIPSIESQAMESENTLIIGEEIHKEDIVSKINSNAFFTKNGGQWDDSFLFIGDTEFGMIGIGNDGYYYNLIDHQNEKGLILKFDFVDCNPTIPYGLFPLAQKKNYFFGNDESKWAVNILNYREIYYENLWDNI